MRQRRSPRSNWLISVRCSEARIAQILLGEVGLLAVTGEVVPEAGGEVDHRLLASLDLPEQAVQRLVLGDDSLVLVAAVDDVGQVAEHVAHVGIGNDHQLVQRREEPPVGGILAAQASGSLRRFG